MEEAERAPETKGDLSPVGDPTRQRLQKYLAAAGIASRRDCEELIKAGRVTVDGKVVSHLGAVVDPSTQTVAFDGEVVKPEPLVYWWVYKPPGFICSSKNEHGQRSVLDLIPPIGKRVYCVGRLEEDGTGLVLLTNDGELALRLTHPRYGARKTYEIQVAGRITHETLFALRRGTWTAEGQIRPHQVRILGAHGRATRVLLTLSGGRNREIRKLFASHGHKVMRLEQVAIGDVKIRKLRMGDARPATSEELAMLRAEISAAREGDEGRPRPGSPPRRRHAFRQAAAKQRVRRRPGKKPRTIE